MTLRGLRGLSGRGLRELREDRLDPERGDRRSSCAQTLAKFFGRGSVEHMRAVGSVAQPLSDATGCAPPAAAACSTPARSSLLHTALVAGSGDRGGAACENTGGDAANSHSICSSRLKTASMALGRFDPDRMRLSKNLFFALGGIAPRAACP